MCIGTLVPNSGLKFKCCIIIPTQLDYGTRTLTVLFYTV